MKYVVEFEKSELSELLTALYCDACRLDGIALGNRDPKEYSLAKQQSQSRLKLHKKILDTYKAVE